MKKLFIGKKIGMTQIIDEDGSVVPVTVLQEEDIQLVRQKSEKSDGYTSYVLSYGSCSEKHLTKSEKGQFKEKLKPMKHMFEANFEDINTDDISKTVGISALVEGDIVNVQSKSIGKGFSGTIKRHNFNRGLMTHGSKSHRLPGSIGAGTGISRVFKGTRMGGRMGNKLTTIENLKVHRIINESKVVLIQGSLPGKKQNIVMVYQR